MRHGLGIDLGTANTVVCHTKRGIVFDEPSVMMLPPVPPRRKRPLAIGREAQDLVGRVGERMITSYPFHDGVVADLEQARIYLAAILRRLGVARWKLPRRKSVICVPVGATRLERRALLEVASEAGLGKSILMPEPVAGAVGAGIDPMSPRAHMVLDIGGGTAEVSVFSYGGMVAQRSSRVAGDEMTSAVYQYLREQHHIVVDKLVAEELKMRASSEESPSLVVSGTDAATGRGRLLTVTIEEVSEAIHPVVDAIIQVLGSCLDDLPARAVGDVMEDGILAIGGGSMLVGFEKLMEAAFGFAICPTERPLTCVAEGAALSLRRPDVLAAYGGT